MTGLSFFPLGKKRIVGKPLMSTPGCSISLACVGGGIGVYIHEYI